MNTGDRFGVGLVGLFAACLVGAASEARAADPIGTPTRLLIGPGSVVPGSPVGDVAFAPLRLVYGDAGWAMNVTMVGHIEQVVTEAGVGVHQGQVLPAGDVVADIWLSLDSDASGRLATTIIDGGGLTAIAIDDAIALRAGDLVPAAGLQAGSTWAVVQSMDFDNSGHLAVLGTIAEPSAPGSPIDAIVRYDVDAGGALGNPVVLVSEHDLIDGRALVAVGYITDLTFARNDDGQLLHTVVFLDEDGQGFGAAAIVLDGVVLAEDGKPSPFPDRDWIVGAADPVALNAQGDYAFRTRIESAPESLDVIVHNGAVVAMEGKPVAGLPGSKITRLHAPRLADDGTLLYLVEWSEGLTPRQGFVVNGQLVVATLATQIEGLTLGGLFNDAWVYDLSADGERFAFVGWPATTAGWGAYEVPTGPWQDLHGSLAGTGAAAPTLFGLGSLESGSTVSLDLAGALPGSVTNLVIGLSQLGLPFKGGVLVPSPDVLLPGFPVDAQGALALSGVLPAGLPSALPLHFQFWTADAGGPHGFSASNGLVGLTP